MSFEGTRGGGATLPRVWPLIEQSLAGKICCRSSRDKRPMVLAFKVIGQMVTSEVSSMTQKSGKSGPDRTTLSVAAMGVFGVLITNIRLVLITDDVIMHLSQVGSGQVMLTGRGPAGYS